MERYHIFKLGLAIVFYAVYFIRPMMSDELDLENNDANFDNDYNDSHGLYYSYYQGVEGKPGVDFPIYSYIPRTSFSCDSLESGYYADLETDCQVFHICEEGRKISFLCPNGTQFQQSDLICEWWFKVTCSDAPSLYSESSEQLRANELKRKASRKVIIGDDQFHGAVMRIEEHASVSALQNGKSLKVANKPTFNHFERNEKISKNVRREKTVEDNFGNYGTNENVASVQNFNDQLSSQDFHDDYTIPVTQSENRFAPPRPQSSNSKVYHEKLERNNKRDRVRVSSSQPQEDQTEQEKKLNNQNRNFDLPRRKGTARNRVVSRGSKKYKDTFSKQSERSNRNDNINTQNHNVQADGKEDNQDTYLEKSQEPISSSTKKQNSKKVTQRARPVKPSHATTKAERNYNHRASTNGNNISHYTSGKQRNVDGDSSEETQVTEETASFVKGPTRNDLRSNKRKNKNPYPNHRQTYSELSNAKTYNNKFINAISSVTPQYITTQSINSGKPFIGSRVGVIVYKNTEPPFQQTTVQDFRQEDVSNNGNDYYKYNSQQPTTITFDSTTDKVFESSTPQNIFANSLSVDFESQKYPNGASSDSPSNSGDFNSYFTGKTKSPLQVKHNYSTVSYFSPSTIRPNIKTQSTSRPINELDYSSSVGLGQSLSSGVPKPTIESHFSFGISSSTAYPNSIVEETTTTQPEYSTTENPIYYSSSPRSSSTTRDYNSNTFNLVSSTLSSLQAVAGGKNIETTTNYNYKSNTAVIDNFSTEPEAATVTEANNFNSDKNEYLSTHYGFNTGKADGSLLSVPLNSGTSSYIHTTAHNAKEVDFVRHTTISPQHFTVSSIVDVPKIGTFNYGTGTGTGTDAGTANNTAELAGDRNNSGSSSSAASKTSTESTSSTSYRGNQHTYLPKSSTTTSSPTTSQNENTYFPKSTTTASLTLLPETVTDRVIDHATVYGSFSKNIPTTPPSNYRNNSSSLGSNTATNSLSSTVAPAPLPINDLTLDLITLPPPLEVAFTFTTERPYTQTLHPGFGEASPGKSSVSGFFVTRDPYELPKSDPLSNQVTSSNLNENFKPLKADIQRPRPFQLSIATTPDEFNNELSRPRYVISTASPFTVSTTSKYNSPAPELTEISNSVYDNIDNMINVLLNITEKDYSSESPRPGLIVPPSVGPETLHSLSVYFANTVDKMVPKDKDGRIKMSAVEKHEFTSLLTKMTMDRYNELFTDKPQLDDENTSEETSTETDLEGQHSKNPIQNPDIRNLARMFTKALADYLEDPNGFRDYLHQVRPTEPPEIIDAEDGTNQDDELLNFSDADTKSNYPLQPIYPKPANSRPTWGYIFSFNNSNTLDNAIEANNSLNPEENFQRADSQSFISQFNNLNDVDKEKVSKNNDQNQRKANGLPDNHWTASPDVTKLFHSTLLVNPLDINSNFPTTYSPDFTTTDIEDFGEGFRDDEEEELEAEVEEILPDKSLGTLAEDPHHEVKYELHSLPDISINSTQVHGILLDFMNNTKSERENKLQRILLKLNTTQEEFLEKMKEIESNPLTKRLILLLISECGENATKIIENKEISLSSLTNSLSGKIVEVEPSGKHEVASKRPNAFKEIVDPTLDDDADDTRALQLLNSLYSIASRFG